MHCLQAEYKKGQDEERARRRELEDNYNSYKGLFHKTSPKAKSESNEKEEERNYTYSEEAAKQGHYSMGKNWI